VGVGPAHGGGGPSGPEPPPAEAVRAGQAVYGPLVLAAYDALVLGASNRLAWRCPTARLLAHYDAHVAATHLDVGAGTGYYLDRCRFPSPAPALSLLDLNPTALRWAARRVRRYRPRAVRGDVLRPIGLAAGSFDSIGLNYVLHCLPGRFPAKGQAIRHLRPLLRDGGVLFGSTILGQGARPNALARRLMAVYNRRGIFSNLDDDPAGLERVLAAHFGAVYVRTVGCVALFVARP
jgi:SAM-dependent methyltransferase